MRGARAFAVTLAAAVLVVAPGEGRGHGPGQPAARDRDGDPAPRLSIPDTPVRDQDGRQLQFYRDLVRDRVVAINFIYTRCATTCPLLGAVFAGLQEVMGDRLGREVFLISVSVDPARDTPARLRAWGRKHGARPGWTLVTGDKPRIDALLRALGVATGSPEDHPPLVLIGDDRAGRWTRAWGLAAPATLGGLLGTMLDARSAAPARQATAR